MCSVHLGDTMSTSGYHEYIGGCSVHREISWCIWETKAFQFILKTLMYWTSPNVLMISPTYIMISSKCIHEIPWCTHDIPLMYSWYPQMYSWYSRCTHGIPPMYWTSPIYWTHIQGVYAWWILCHILSTADKILNQIKSKISSQPKMEESMTEETAWFRTYAIRTDPPPSTDSLVNSQLPLTWDGENLNSDALWGLSPDHLVGAEFI